MCLGKRSLRKLITRVEPGADEDRIMMALHLNAHIILVLVTVS
jgi:hypothetical protein